MEDTHNPQEGRQHLVEVLRSQVGDLCSLGVVPERLWEGGPSLEVLALLEGHSY